jgi:hypothetical protein
LNERLRAFVAGVVGMGIAFGLVELVHGLYDPVPSVPVAVSQRVIVLMPGNVAELAIGILGEWDIPTLVTTIVILTLALAGLLALLALRSVAAALVGVGVLGAIAIAASFTEPSVAPIATVLTVVGALGAGSGVAGFLMYASGLESAAAKPSPEPSGQDGGREPRGARYREAGSLRWWAWVPRARGAS